MRYSLDPQNIIIRFLLLMAATALLLGCAPSKLVVDEWKQYAAGGDWDKSVQILQKAYNENPDDRETKILLYRAKKQASFVHLVKGEAFLEKHRYEEAIREFQMAIAFDPSNIKAEDMIKKAIALNESRHYVKKGEDLLKARKYAQAREAFLKALELNPGDEKAKKALAGFKKKEERPPHFRLKIDRETPVSLKFKNTPILNVFEVLTRLTGVNFVFDRDVQETKVTLFVTDISFDEFLSILLKTNRLAAKLVNDKTLMIYPDTPSKRKEYRDLKIRTFYLANLDVKKAVALLSKILNSKDIIANEKLNAVVIRGTEELIDVASKVIEANDRPTSEVMLNVEILEVSRSKEKNLGIEFDPASLSIGLGEPALDFFNSASDSDSYRATGSGSLHALDRISSENILFSLPTATLNLLKQDGDTKTLANPQIRVKNSEKAQIHIGERVPLRTNRRVDTTGAVTTDFQYQDVGVKLDVKPTINIHDEITLDLTLEVSALGDNVGTTSDPQYAIRTRKAKSVLTIRPGETVIIGGLISDEERRTIRKIPFLGDIPAVGRLFSNENTDNSKTDIIMAITPIIIRSQEIPETEVSEIWSGNEGNFSLREPFESYLARKEAYSDIPEMEPSPPAPVKGPGSGQTEEKDEVNPEKPVDVKPSFPSPVLPEETPPSATESDSSRTEKHPTPIQVSASVSPPMAGPERAPDQASVPESANTEEAWPPSTPYSIQVNSFLRPDDAELRVKSLRESGYDSFTFSKYIPSKQRIYYRVFVGRFPDLKSAKEYREILLGRKQFRKDIHVVKRDWAIGG
ncbi:MAG: SPOR domain-containing protein [Deltaproteobacteria bacterium]|nr:SPOR domain-containing protein [Deltaproteobacteria bacterium]